MVPYSYGVYGSASRWFPCRRTAFPMGVLMAERMGTASWCSEPLPACLLGLQALPDFYPLQACRSLSLLWASFPFIVTRPQIHLWLGRPETKASLAEGWDPCHVPRDQPQSLAGYEGGRASYLTYRGHEPACTPLPLGIFLERLSPALF